MSHPDDLLQPSLNEGDDLKGFHNPWNPHSLIVAAFFAGPFAGGFLLSLNFKRLGMPERFKKSLFVFIGLGLLIYITVAVLNFYGVIEKSDVERVQILRIVTRVATLLAAYWAVVQQRERFRLYNYSGGPAANAWVSGILAVLAGVAINYGLCFVIGFLLVFLTKAI